MARTSSCQASAESTRVYRVGYGWVRVRVEVMVGVDVMVGVMVGDMVGIMVGVRVGLRVGVKSNSRLAR
jgi:hypothetical protein